MQIVYINYVARLEKYFVFLENWTFFCPVLGSRHCTRAYVLKQLTQPAFLASLNFGTGKVLYGKGQFGSIWEKKRHPSPPFLSRCTYSFDCDTGGHGFKTRRSNINFPKVCLKCQKFAIYAWQSDKNVQSQSQKKVSENSLIYSITMSAQHSVVNYGKLPRF